MAAFMVIGLFSAASAQDKKETPKPGREHDLLKQFEGQWDAVAKGSHDGKETQSRGAELVRVGYDGFWLVIDYSGDHDGKPFAGHGTMGYDPIKKKYLLTWIDNIAPFAMWAEGDADSSGKKFTFTSEGFCPEFGKVATVRTVMEIQDAKHRTLTFYRPDQTGTEKKMGEIQYTRQS
ncbi:MAG TPA: DUF1579 domain-containing protein [Planctomycetota bacterium]|nr:DUF1579 domain-containing protein [Planctomycetota bacterium]